MITSMMGRMADAEKLSIPQLQHAIKSGSIPAYVGIPMLQDKIKQTQQAKESQPVPPQPPVAQQVMAEADGITSVPSNLPTATYRDGGIVAFADGGMDDEYDPEDYEDQVAEAEYAGAIQDMENTQEEMMQHQLDMQRANSELRTAAKDIHNTPDVEGGVAGLGEHKPYDQHHFVRGVGGGHKGIDYAMPVGTPVSPKVEGILRYNTRDPRGWGNAAEIINEDGKVLQRFAHLSKFAAPEGSRVTPGQVIGLSGNTGRSTGPHLHVENFYADGGITRLNNVPRFGDGGSTWRDYAAPLLPGAAIYTVGGRLGNVMQSGIEGIRNSVANVTSDNPARDQMARDYTNNLNESTSDESLMDRPVLTPMGEGFRNYGYQIQKRLKDFIGTKPKDIPPGARTYLDNGMFTGLPSTAGASYAPARPRLEDIEISEDNQGWLAGENARLAGHEPKTEMTPATAATNKVGGGDTSAGNTSGGNVPSGDMSGGNTSTGASENTAGINALTPRKSAFDQFTEDYKRSKEDLSKQKEEDKYMALIAAGLGMMSGTSPNAFANLGQGAMQGIASYQQSGKQRAAEKAALDKSMMSAQRYKSMEEIALANQALRERMHGDTLGMQGRRLNIDEALKNEQLILRGDTDLQTRIKNAEAEAQRKLKNEWDDIRRIKDPKGYEAAVSAIENNPDILRMKKMYQQRLKERYPDYVDDQTPSAPTGNTIKFDSSGAKIK